MENNTQSEAEPTLDLTSYLKTIKRAKWSILAFTLVAVLFGGFIAFSSTPVYQASAQILADPQPPNAGRDEQYVATAMVFLFYETQYEIIQSRKIAEQVVDKLGLIERYKQKQLTLQNEKPSGINALLSEIKAIAGLNSAKEKATSSLSDSEIRTMLASGIRANLSVSGGKQSQIIDISYNDPSPEMAAKVINAVAEAYIQFGLTSRLEEVKDTESWLSDQAAQLRNTLQNSENRLAQYRRDNGLVDTMQQERLANSQLQTLNNELIRAQTELHSAEEAWTQVKDIPSNSNELYSVSAVLQNPTTNSMVTEEAKLNQKVNELTERYGEKHPKMIAARSELRSARENLNSTVAKVVENIEKNYRLAQLQVSNITAMLRQQRNNIQDLQAQNFELIALEREVENNRRIYENFQVSLMETTGRSQFTSSNVQIIDTATVPKFPVKPNKKLIILMSAIFGVFIGIVYAFVREMLNNTFRTTEQTEETLGITCLGLKPKVPNKKNEEPPEFQYLRDTRSVFAESINTIRTGLVFSNIDNPPQTLMVTSANSEEGKSTLAINLASAYSQIGRTLLLEVDLRKPSLNNYMGLQEQVGLTDLMSGSSSISDVLANPYDTNLYTIRAGVIPHNPLETISSEKFGQLLTQLKQHFDHIILDCAPVLPVSDAGALGSKVDGVIFAVRAERTSLKAAKEAVSRLKRLNVNVIGSVLTLAEPQKMSDYGDHYYVAEYYGTKLQTN